MASLSGVSSNTLAGTSSLRGYGGLASGLDRDSLIEQMTYATRMKIAAQEKKKTSVSWEQEIIRDISSKLHGFSETYMSFTSSSNLTSSKFFTGGIVEASGTHSNKFDVTGASNSLSNMSVVGIKQLAKDANMISKNTISSQKIETGVLTSNFADIINESTIVGDSFTVKHGADSYMVHLSEGEGYDFSSTEATIASINKALDGIEMKSGEKLSSVIQFEQSGGTVSIKNTDTAGNALAITSHSGDFLNDIGMLAEGESLSTLEESKLTINGSSLTATHTAVLNTPITVAEKLSGAEMSFTYNGTTATIVFGDFATTDGPAELMADMQQKLNQAFGDNRIEVGLDGGALSFVTTIPPGSGETESVVDTSSRLTINSATSGLIGETGLFGISSGTTNRLNYGKSIEASGLVRGESLDKTQPMTITNNGVTIDLSELGLSWDSAVADIVGAINDSEELGIEISYESYTDKFVVTSDNKGAGGTIDLSGEVADVLFGTASTDYMVQAGQDAILAIQYGGSGEVVEVTRGSNQVEVDGLVFDLKQTFGYTAGIRDTTTEAVTFKNNIDTKESVKGITEMVEAYNEIIALISETAGTKPDRDYAPLTDEQKEEMSESEIENWEKKAKEGILFNDSDINNLKDDLRTVISPNIVEILRGMGISTSSSYFDNGKLVIDEVKLEAALAKDPNAVYEAFNNEENGLMTSMERVIDKHAAMTGGSKGILVERAGSQFSPISVNDNYIQELIDEYDERIEELEDTLETEEARYIQQFTTLETLISQMNSQSNYLTSFMGGL